MRINIIYKNLLVESSYSLFKGNDYLINEKLESTTFMKNRFSKDMCI